MTTTEVKDHLQIMYKIIMNGRYNDPPTLSKKNSVLEMVECNTTLMLGMFKEMSERIEKLEKKNEKLRDALSHVSHALPEDLRLFCDAWARKHQTAELGDYR